MAASRHTSTTTNIATHLYKNHNAQFRIVRVRVLLFIPFDRAVVAYAELSGAGMGKAVATLTFYYGVCGQFFDEAALLVGIKIKVQGVDRDNTGQEQSEEVETHGSGQRFPEPLTPS